mgnify:CR=1 FL=1
MEKRNYIGVLLQHSADGATCETLCLVEASTFAQAEAIALREARMTGMQSAHIQTMNAISDTVFTQGECRTARFVSVKGNCYQKVAEGEVAKSRIDVLVEADNTDELLERLNFIFSEKGIDLVSEGGQINYKLTNYTYVIPNDKEKIECDGQEI